MRRARRTTSPLVHEGSTASVLAELKSVDDRWPLYGALRLEPGAPARIFHLPGGSLRRGAAADVTVFEHRHEAPRILLEKRGGALLTLR